jgi:hypothetical protein
MRKSVALLFLPVIFGFSRPKYNENPIILHFEEILNEYRTTKGLGKVSIDESIKPLTDQRSEEIYEIFEHGDLKQKISILKLKYTNGYENIVKFKIPTQTDKPNYQHFKEIINEKGDTIVIESKKLNEVKNDMARGNVSNYKVAEYCIEKWKFSKEHNNTLLNPEIKRFYLSYYYDESKTSYYFCFVALD